MILNRHPLDKGNVPLYRQAIVPVHKEIQSKGKRKYISHQQISQFAQSGIAGISYTDIMSQFSCSKRKAQRMLKNAHSNLILFTAGDLVSQGLELPPSFKNTRPQRYYATATKADTLEKLKKERKNVLLESTGTGTSPRRYPLSNCLENQKANHFIDIMTKLPFRPLLMHKIILKMSIDAECYQLINSTPWKGNLGRSIRESIDNIIVVYTYYKNGKVQIHIACSSKPFPLQTEEDLAILYSFFGQVKDRLEYHVSDPRGRLVPKITKWILEQCDFNKDVPITDKAQMTLPDMQLSTAFETFRLYVKNLEGEANYRCEASVQVNRALPQYLACTINPSGEILSKLDMLNEKLDRL